MWIREVRKTRFSSLSDDFSYTLKTAFESGTHLLNRRRLKPDAAVPEADLVFQINYNFHADQNGCT